MTAKGFEQISPQRKYQGISAQIIGQIKNVRVPFNVDIDVGDVIVPRAEIVSTALSVLQKMLIFKSVGSFS